MSNIDRQRYAAVRALEAAGYTWTGIEWVAPVRIGADAGDVALLVAAADAMHAELVGQCEDIAGSPAGSDEAETLERLTELAQAYEAVRPMD